MKTRNTLALAALVGMGMLGLTSCNEEHDLRTQPPGTGLLALGEVTVAGTDVAGTRAAIAQDAAGFIGIRKTEFKAGDVLALSLSVPQGAPAGSPLSTTAKLDANGWTLADRTYYAAGTKLTATYTATPAAGTPAAALAHKDDLTATITPVADGTPIALTLTHANALIEVTPPAGITGDAYTIKVNATPTAASAEDLATAREEGTTTDQLRYRTIALPGTVNSITLTANGITYTATLNSLQVEANKRYPIALSVKDSQLTATVNPAGDLNWGDGGTSNGHPAGYSRYIATAEDLAQYAADVTKNTNGAGLAAYTALQVADIDLGTLRTAADANTYYNTSKYNYTATKDNWMPIANNSNFIGSYNGNGFTISNLTITQSGSGSPRPGFFGTLVNAKVTGVHLRNCQITSSGVAINAAGTLAAYATNSTVTLCSATGSVSVDESTFSTTTAKVGGLIGWCNNNGVSNSVNRCSSDVAVSLNSKSGGYCGAFVGLTLNTSYAACIASGTVTKAGASGTFSGFSTQEATSTYGGYRAYSCITNSEIVKTDGSEIVKTDGSERSAFGMSALLLSCIATQPSYTNFAVRQSGQPANCVCLGSVTDNIYNEVSFSVTADQAYSKLTKARTTNILPMKTLHWSKDDGYTLNEVTITNWDFITKAWVESPNGLALPTLDMSYEGTPAP